MLSYLYYTFYKFVLVTPSRKEMPEHLANTTMSLFLSLNVLALMYYLRNQDVSIAEIFLNNKMYYVITFVIFLILGYLFFVKDGKYIKIKEKYDKDSKKVKYVKMSLVFIYVIVSFIIPLKI